MNKSLLNSKPGGSKKNPGHNLNSSANKAVIFCQITISDINRPSLKSEVISTKIMRVEKGVIIIKQLKMMWLNGDPLHSTTRDDFLWVDQLFHVVVIMRYLCCQRKYETLDNQQSLQRSCDQSNFTLIGSSRCQQNINQGRVAQLL